MRGFFLIAATILIFISLFARWAALPGAFIVQTHIFSNLIEAFEGEIKIGDRVQWRGTITHGKQRVRFQITGEGGISLSVRAPGGPAFIASKDAGYLTPGVTDEFYFIVDMDRIAVSEDREKWSGSWWGIVQSIVDNIDRIAAYIVQTRLIWL